MDALTDAGDAARTPFNLTVGAVCPTGALEDTFADDISIHRSFQEILFLSLFFHILRFLSTK